MDSMGILVYGLIGFGGLVVLAGIGLVGYLLFFDKNDKSKTVQTDK